MESFRPLILYTPKFRIFPWVVTRKRTINLNEVKVYQLRTAEGKSLIMQCRTRFATFVDIIDFYLPLIVPIIFIDYCHLLQFIYKIALLN